MLRINCLPNVPSIAVLFPRFDHPAIEERYASWQSQMLLRSGGLDVVFYDAEEPASLAVSEVSTEFVLVVTDPLLVPPSRLGLRLRDLLDATPGARVALPVSNEAEHPAQRRSPEAAYLTLRELQEMTARMQTRGVEGERVTWDGSDPAVYLCHVVLLEECDDIPRRGHARREVAISTNDYVHRWIPMRADMRSDLLLHPRGVPCDRGDRLWRSTSGRGDQGAATQPRRGDRARPAGGEGRPQANRRRLLRRRPAHRLYSRRALRLHRGQRDHRARRRSVVAPGRVAPAGYAGGTP